MMRRSQLWCVMFLSYMCVLRSGLLFLEARFFASSSGFAMVSHRYHQMLRHGDIDMECSAV
jgi:hypothetical protein